MKPLEETTEAYGSKAYRLGLAIRRGFRVPPGWAIAPEEIEPLLNRGLPPISPGPWAVRSSAIGEDSQGASFAGQHETVLNVRSLDEAVRRVWNSVRSPAALEYRKRMGITGEPKIAVVIQRMVPADCAGVLFTRNPVTGADERVIEAAWGLGESVVAGLVTPDHFRIDSNGCILERTAGMKDVAIRPAAEGVQSVAENRVQELCLDDQKLAKLFELAGLCEEHFGPAQDIEWAFAGDELYLLQCRPMTVHRRA
jgi:pyruvate,water dikinase